VPFRQIYREDMQLAAYVRAAGDAKSMLPIVRQKVREIDPNVNVFDAVPLAEYIGASLYAQKIAASLLTVLGSLAVILGAVGLYSVMSYSVVQRTHEVGIRMALGARPDDVLRLTVRQGLTWPRLACWLDLLWRSRWHAVFQRSPLPAPLWGVAAGCWE
jgi:putative ABC transport system permease protein